MDDICNHLSLCAGIGGIDLGLRRVVRNLSTVAMVEKETFCIANLVKEMEKGTLDPCPVYTDLLRFPWQRFRGRVDIVSGGIPCQPFSVAGSRKATEDERHLWPHIKSGMSVLETESASSRTSMESPQPSRPDTTQFSTMSSATWKKWVSSNGRTVLSGRKLAHHTCESDGSFSAWPTPTPIHATRGNHDEPVEKYQKRVRDYEEGRAKGKPGKSLGVAVNWPTPTTQNAEVTQHPKDHSSSTGSQEELLNPSWVDTLMGFPIGWTDLGLWGTPLFQK